MTRLRKQVIKNYSNIHAYMNATITLPLFMLLNTVPFPYFVESIFPKSLFSKITDSQSADYNNILSTLSHFINGRVFTVYLWVLGLKYVCSYQFTRKYAHDYMKSWLKCWCTCGDSLWRHVHSQCGIKFSSSRSETAVNKSRNLEEDNKFRH